MTLQEEVLAFFESQDTKYLIKKGEEGEPDNIHIIVNGDHGNWEGIALCYEQERFLVFYVNLGMKVPQEKKQALAEGMDAVLRLRGIRKDTFGCQVTKEKAEKGNLAIVCHLGVGQLLLSYLLDLSPYTVFRSFFLAPASITTVLLEEYGDGKAGFRILQMGDVSHMVSQGIEVVRSGLQYNKD